MVSMPWCLASPGFRMDTAWPFTRIEPSSGGRAPESAFMSVDLPAPLPPTRPMTSPAWTLTETPSTACTPPKETRISRMSTTGTRPSTAMASSPSAGALAEQLVEAHGRHQHDSDRDVLRWVVELEQLHARDQRLDDQGAQDRARDGAD